MIAAWHIPLATAVFSPWRTLPVNWSSHAPCAFYHPKRSSVLYSAHLPLRFRTIDVPFPNPRLAMVALQALDVDKERSPLVRRTLSLTTAPDVPSGEQTTAADKTVVRVSYSTSTNRMMRVAVKALLDSLALVLEVMEELDVDVLEAQNATAS